jgi:transcriptional regulator with XRE-family HTH domain
MTFRELRERAGFNQVELAARSGVQQTTISQLDLGKVTDPRWSTIQALAVALETTPDVVARAISMPPKPTAKRARVA